MRGVITMKREYQCDVCKRILLDIGCLGTMVSTSKTEEKNDKQ